MGPAAAGHSSITYKHQSSSSSTSVSNSTSTSSMGCYGVVGGMNESMASFGKDGIEPPHRHANRTACFQAVVINKVTPEPTDEYAASIASSSSHNNNNNNMMDHFEGGDDNDVVVMAELSQTINDSRCALEVSNNNNNDHLLLPQQQPGCQPSIAPVKSSSFAIIGACPVVGSGKGYYSHHNGDRSKHPVGDSEAATDENAPSQSDGGPSSQHRELCARKLSLHYPVDNDDVDILGESKSKSKGSSQETENMSTTTTTTTTNTTTTKIIAGKGPPHQLIKRRNQAIQELFEPPLKKQGVLTQPDHFFGVSKECLSEEMDLSIRSDIDEPPMLEVQVIPADKLKRVKRSSKTAARPSSTATVSLQRPCTRGSKKL